jgi:hypothetical protein
MEDLETYKITNLPKLPPKILFLNDEKLNERQRNLEEFLKQLFKVIDIRKNKIVLNFIKCPNNVIDILNNKDFLNSSAMRSTTYMSVNSKRNANNNNKSIINPNNNKNNVYYSSSYQLFIQNKTYIEDDESICEEDKISANNMVIREFLRNLIEYPLIKLDLLNQFEYFLKNENKKSYLGWLFLEEEDIKLFFEGYYSNIDCAKINGFLFHCGNIQNNIIGTQKCLEFLKKLLSEDFNPQVETFIKIFRKTSLENIIQMELENHIINNCNNRINAYVILSKYVGNGNNINNKIKRILMHPDAEKLFMEWYKNQDFE